MDQHKNELLAFMEIVNDFAALHLIEEAGKVITQPYSDWKIGVCSNGKIDSEGSTSLTVFNPQNSAAAVAAYKHFRGLGVIAVEPFYTDAEYLYMYNIKKVNLEYLLFF